MSYAVEVDRSYAATRMTIEEGLTYALEHMCRRQGCESVVEDTVPCDICEEPFCPAHLFDGMCKRCFEIDAAADELNEEKRAA